MPSSIENYSSRVGNSGNDPRNASFGAAFATLPPTSSESGMYTSNNNLL